MSETLRRAAATSLPALARLAPLPPPDLATFQDLSYWYPASTVAALDGIDFALGPGLTLVAGDSAGGKSSLLRVLNGLVPHFHGGRIRGDAIVLGDSVVQTPTRRLARNVGFVFQDPETQFVFTTVEQEVAFGPCNIGLPRALIGDRLDESLAAVGIAELRQRRLASLSGGERQRVALASALAMGPQLLALDEPTSQLDPAGAEAFLDACVALATGGASVAIAEHRIERLLPVADRLVIMQRGRAIGPATPRQLVGRLPYPPALVRLGQRLGWEPMPLTLDEARTQAPRLGPGVSPRATLAPAAGSHGDPVWEVRSASLGLGSSPVLSEINLAGRAGEVIVLMGDNGSGKTTLLRAIAGLVPALSGTITRRPGRIAYLPQDPSALLHRPTVRDEVQLTLSRTGSAEPVDSILSAMGLLPVADSYPRDLSGGERQRTAIAAIVAGDPQVVLLDEPTRGMDGASLEALGAVIARLRDSGSSVVIATHDADLAAAVGERIIRLSDGGAIDLGGPDSALSGDAVLATQIGRLYQGGPVTVDAVLACL